MAALAVGHHDALVLATTTVPVLYTRFESQVRTALYTGNNHGNPTTSLSYAGMHQIHNHGPDRSYTRCMPLLQMFVIEKTFSKWPLACW
jgi:hypothetical protein